MTAISRLVVVFGTVESILWLALILWDIFEPKARQPPAGIALLTDNILSPCIVIATYFNWRLYRSENESNPVLAALTVFCGAFLTGIPVLVTIFLFSLAYLLRNIH